MSTLTDQEQRAARLAELRNKHPNYGNGNSITDQPYSYDRTPPRPPTLPGNNGKVTKIDDNWGGGKNNNQNRQIQQQQSFELVQMVVPYFLSDKYKIVIPIPTDLYYNPSDPSIIRRGSYWEKKHSNIKIKGMEWGDRIEPFDKNNNNEVWRVHNDTTGEIMRYIELVDSGQLFEVQNVTEEKVVYIDKIPRMHIITMWAMLAIIAYLITLLFFAPMR